MLDNQTGSSRADEESAFVERLQKSRASGPEPDDEPTGGAEDEALEVESGEPEDDGYIEHTESDGEPIDTEDDDPDAQQEPSTYRVKVDGQELEVDLEELKNGYQRDSDYRKKTMALSDERKALEAKEAQVEQKLQELTALVKQSDDVDWDELRDTDPDEYIRQKELFEKRSKKAQEAQAELSKKRQEQLQQVVTEQSQALVEKMGPTWDEDKRKADIQAANEYWKSMGLTEAEIGSIVDHRMYLMAFDAAKGRKLAQKSAQVSKEVRNAPKSVRPGQRQPVSTQEYEKAKANLRNANKTNEIDLGVAALQAKRAKKGK